MADFKIAHSLLQLREGGYYWYSGDYGGETWSGISRVNFPFWQGWQIVDQAKKQVGTLSFIDNSSAWEKITSLLNVSYEIKVLKVNFYEKNFWEKIAGEAIINQGLANYIYDCAVNNGVQTAIRWVQSIIISLGEDAFAKRKWPIVALDGVVSKSGETIAVINLISLNPKYLELLMSGIRSYRTVNIIEQGIVNKGYRSQAEGLMGRVYGI